MINSDRVTSSSDDLSHMMTSSPPASATRRYRDDDVVDVDNARNSASSRLSHDKTRVQSESASSAFTHLPTAPLVSVLSVYLSVCLSDTTRQFFIYLAENVSIVILSPQIGWPQMTANSSLFSSRKVGGTVGVLHGISLSLSVCLSRCLSRLYPCLQLIETGVFTGLSKLVVIRAD